MKITHHLFGIGLIACALYSCSSETTTKEHITVEQDDVSNSLTTNFDKIFSIPSPILTMLLLKKVSPAFHPELLNPTSKVDSYQTEHKRALLLGVYGADLGYSSIYKDKKNIIDYLVTVEKLTNSLGLGASFDNRFIERYQKNTNNSDSMLYIVSDAFKNADLFLKNGQRKSVSALILAGGWTESMHFATTLAEKNNNQELLERIGDQQQTLTTLIALLEENNKASVNDELIRLYKELSNVFQEIEIMYTYNEPVTDAEKKTTTLKHTVSFEISTETLKAITEKITAIRQHIIG